jgi:hypothetical protein
MKFFMEAKHFGDLSNIEHVLVGGGSKNINILCGPASPMSSQGGLCIFSALSALNISIR